MVHDVSEYLSIANTVGSNRKVMSQKISLKGTVWLLNLPIEEAAGFLNVSSSLHEVAGQHRKQFRTTQLYYKAAKEINKNFHFCWHNIIFWLIWLLCFLMVSGLQKIPGKIFQQ